MSTTQQPDFQDLPAPEGPVEVEPAAPTPAERISRALGTAPADAQRSADA